MQPLRQRVIVVGAGIGGLAAAIELGRRGIEVVLLERARSTSAARCARSRWAAGRSTRGTYRADDAGDL
jgi:2-polyprenyl-6-methoxyphenol hydroxylase-like FAD-dependent oxidoreductase